MYDEKLHLSKTQLRSAGQRNWLIRDKPFIVQPRTVRAGKIYNFIFSFPFKDHCMPPRDARLMPAQCRKIEHVAFGWSIRFATKDQFLVKPQIYGLQCARGINGDPIIRDQGIIDW